MVADLYPIIDNPLDVFLSGPCRNAHRVFLAKTHASSNYRHSKHVRIQIVQPIARGLSMVERLPTAYDMLHSGADTSTLGGSDPRKKSIIVGYNPIRQYGPWQPGPHKLQPARLTISPIGWGDYLKCTRNRIGLL